MISALLVGFCGCVQILTAFVAGCVFLYIQPSFVAGLLNVDVCKSLRICHNY